MNTQEGFSKLLGLLFIIALVGGGLYLYSEKILNEIIETSSTKTPAQDGMETEESTSKPGDSNVKKILAEPILPKLAITGIIESFKDEMINMGEQIRITGNNFLPGYDLSVYLRPSNKNSTHREYPLIVKSSGDMYVEALVPSSGIEDIYGGYHLVVKGKNGEASVPVSVATQSLNVELANTSDVKIVHSPGVYSIGDTVTLKYYRDDTYLDHDIFVELRNVNSGEIIKYGNIENGMPLNIIDQETSSFVLESATNQGLILKKEAYDMCIWIITKGDVGDCSYDSVIIK